MSCIAETPVEKIQAIDSYQQVHHSGICEHFITIQGAPDSDPGIMFENLDRHLLTAGGTIAKMDIIGRINNWDRRQRQEYCFNCNECPSGKPDLGSCPITGIRQRPKSC
ncbi:MAG: hypothetical protein ACI8W8_004550 [Rhodothermales bacterium]|jgi:hypothetical protein